MAIVDRDALRRRLGRVGVWGALALRPTAEERRAAAELERLGYGALWFGEGPASKEAFTHAAILLGATQRIVVATGIANIYGRDATAMQNAALALADAHPGRFVLGLGISHAPLVQARGHDYGQPVTAMLEYLDAMERVKYAPPPPPEPPARVLAALRRRMLELARDRTDGAHPYLVTPEHTARARTVLGREPILAPEQGVGRRAGGVGRRRRHRRAGPPSPRGRSRPRGHSGRHPQSRPRSRRAAAPRARPADLAGLPLPQYELTSPGTTQHLARHARTRLSVMPLTAPGLTCASRSRA